jgi:transposase-like protein
MVTEAGMRCGKCGSESSVKAGFNHGRQRYKCKKCGRQFTRTSDGRARDRAQALYLYVVGLSMNSIARMFGVAPSTVLYWVKNFALRVYEKPTPKGPVAIELDEMWHFLHKKKAGSGSGRRIAALQVSWLTGSAGTAT